MSNPPIEFVEVLLGTHQQGQIDLFGPLPGRRCGDVLAYEMQAPTTFRPKPGRTRVERKYVLLDLGVSFGIPCWDRWTRPDGEVVIIPLEQRDTWYVDLMSVEIDDRGRYVLRDLFVDVMINPGRTPRMLDLDEFADACAAGWITTDQLVDGLRRWQRFLDRHLHTDRFPQPGLSDFPPAAIRPLEQIDGLFGPPITWPG